MTEKVFNVRVSAAVRNGMLIEVSLHRIGIENLWLRVHVRIAGH